MALACKCDRCGKYFESSDDLRCNVIKIGIARPREIDTNTFKKEEQLDLCRACFNSFEKWKRCPIKEGE